MKSRRRLVAIVCAAAIALTCVAVATGGFAPGGKGEAEDVKDAGLKTLVVGSDSYPPYISDDENGDPAGIDVDILTEALRRIGYKPRFKLIDWEQKKELLAQGKIDCIMGCFTMTGREDEYRWAGPYMKSRQVVAVDTESDIHTLADLAGKTVGVQSTTKPETILVDGLNSKVPQIGRVYSFSDRAYINPALVDGLVDAIAAHETSILTYEKDYGVTYRILDEPLLEVGLGTAFDLDDTRGIDVKLARVYREMIADGTMEKILTRYFDDPSSFLEVGDL